jgi:hypothetical protein
MKSRRGLLVAAGLLVVLILAFFLQDVIDRVVVTPLAYLWWAIKLIYAELPQLYLWILLLAGLVFILIASLTKWVSISQKFEENSKPSRGPVEVLGGWIMNSREGNYYKWRIANRLGKLGCEVDERLEGRGHLTGTEDLDGRGRLPSEAVQRYLRAGLDESFVDYPRSPLPFMRRKTTPFDLDIDEAVEFLESQMEARSGKKHT